MTGTPSGYRPGVCNIGGRERRRRYRYAGVCAAVAVAYAVGVIVLSSVPTALLLGLFVPLSLGTEFLLQARRSFCASLGFRGRFDLRGDGVWAGDDPVVADGGGVGSRVDGDDGSSVRTTRDGVGRVTDPAARTADRRYAFRLTVLGVVGGAFGAVLAYGTATLLG